MKCECGNDRFIAGQTQNWDVFVDEHGKYLKNDRCYDLGNPFAPFTCTKCGKEYDNLEE